MKACEVRKQWGFQRFPTGGAVQQRALPGVDQSNVVGQRPSVARSIELTLHALRVQSDITEGQQRRQDFFQFFAVGQSV
ncbi:hypothetical protein D3C80_1180440 [compost metagenome]